MTIQEILRKTCSRHRLSPLDAGILLSLALKRPREYILAHPEKQLTKPQEKKFISSAKRRSAGEPIAYIAGKKEFFGLDLSVNKNVLIPRPETELLVEEAIRKINLFFCHPGIACPPMEEPGIQLKIVNRKFLDSRWSLSSCNGAENDKLTLIDIGTGSGNIIISILKNTPTKIKNKINFYAVDISKEPLRIARANAKTYRVEKYIKFIRSNVLEYFLENKIKFTNTLIIANLPYVSQNIYKKNKTNLKYEPKQALSSPGNGLAHYKKLFKQLKLLPTARCSLFIEISPEQKVEICRIIKKFSPKAKTKFHKDLAGRWRLGDIEIISPLNA